MVDVAQILGLFCTEMKDEILDYYDRFYSYIRDLFADKSIDLKFKTTYESDKAIKGSVEKMVKTIKVGLSTIGVSRKKIDIESEIIDEFDDYNSYFLNYKTKIDRILFEILLEYLADVDASKIENLDLFDLLPRKFIYNLDEFISKNLDTDEIKENLSELIPTVNEYVNCSTIAMLIDVEVPTEELEEKPKVEEVEQPDIPEVEIDNLTAFKASIKASAVIQKPEDTSLEQEIEVESAKPAVIEAETATEMISAPPKEIPSDIRAEVEETEVREIPVLEIPEIDEGRKSFLSNIGRFEALKPELISKLKINTLNLITSRNNDPNFLNLENLFYYISILRMLKIDLPFDEMEIAKMTLKFINEEKKIFSSSTENPPDPLNMFYGLSIYSELDLLNNTDIIDLLDVEMFLEEEIKKFMPEKLHLNFYTLASLEILKKNGAIISEKEELLDSLIGLDVKSLEKYDPVLDILEQAACIKLIDKNAELSHYKEPYMKELNSLVADSGAVKDTITDTARALLIMDLLNLKKTHFKEAQQFLKYIYTATEFFNSTSEEFDWRSDKIGYSVELRMLFWALLACGQYNAIV